MTDTLFQHWSFVQDDLGILWLKLDRKNSSANTLNKAVLDEFDSVIERIAKIEGLKAIVLHSGKSTGFIMGADIEQFRDIKDPKEGEALITQGHAVFQKLENLSVPTIAMIEGFCLGGGLELALACRYRVALEADKTKIGLPEVKLGLHPGWGGTVRLPRLIGPMAALDVMLTGRMLSAKAARKLGIVDASVPLRLLKQVVTQFALKPPFIKRRQDLRHVANISFLRGLLGKYLLAQLNKKVYRTHYPAPYAMVENWIEYGVQDPAASRNEVVSMVNMLSTSTSQNLVRVFFLQEALKNLGKEVKSTCSHVHVIGAGVMGGDIAAYCALKGMTVTLQDLSPPLIAQAVKRAYQLAMKKLKEPHLVTAMMDRLSPDVEGTGIAKADVIIEAISEKLEAKQSLFAMIEAKARKDAIIATNTSTLMLEKIAEKFKNPERLVGIHFFNPVEKMPLVEIVHAPLTNSAIVAQALAFVRKIDKLPLPVKSAPGFLVNRILLPYMLEAVCLLDEGISPTLIDKAALEFGMPMGPIELADTVGLDVCLAALEGVSHLMNARIPEKLTTLVAQKALGRKTGKGFYTYHGKKVEKPKIGSTELAPPDMIERLTGRIFNEAMAVWREGIVGSADLIDAGCIFGFGFPPFLGGPLHYVTTQGKEKIRSQLEQLKNRYGDRFNLDPGWTTF